MLWEIVKKEIHENITSLKFIYTFLLCIILILFSIFVGVNNYIADLSEYNTAVALNKKNLESEQRSSIYEIKINRPPQVLGTIITGIQNDVSRQAIVHTSFDTKFVDSKYDSTPVFAMFGGLDLTVVVTVILSLFAILFTYDAIVGEKERGTLRLILSNDLPRDKLILGKIIGSFISLMIPLVIPFILGVIILLLSPDIQLLKEDWIRIGLIFILFFLYLSVFFTLGIFVSSRTSRSSSSLFILLFVWVIFITVIPKAAVMFAGQINPIQSVHEITAQKDAFYYEIEKNSGEEVKDIIYTEKKVNESQEEHKNRIMKMLSDHIQRINAEIDAKYAEIEKEYHAKRNKQQIIAMNLSRISPASLLAISVMNLGKTGIHEYERFINSIKEYKSMFTKWADSKRIERIGSKTGEQLKSDISDMPRYEFSPESLRDSFARSLPDFMIMILYIILFFIGAFVSFLRYDVR